MCLCQVIRVHTVLKYLKSHVKCIILDEALNLSEFREFCKKNLQNPDACLRSRLLNVLQHSFFTHEFIRIHAFLEELPLKTDIEREEFFT